MTPDDEFLHAFFALTLPNSEFRHRDHLRLAWLAVRRHGGGSGDGRHPEVRPSPQPRPGVPRHHDQVLGAAGRPRSVRPSGVEDFEEFLAAYPMLLDKNTPLQHWSRDTMFGAEARAEWREPDLVALPF